MTTTRPFAIGVFRSIQPLSTEILPTVRRETSGPGGGAATDRIQPAREKVS